MSGHRTSLRSQQLFLVAEQCPESCQGTTGCSTPPGPGASSTCPAVSSPKWGPQPPLPTWPLTHPWHAGCCSTSWHSSVLGVAQSPKQSSQPLSPTSMLPACCVQQHQPLDVRVTLGRSCGRDTVIGTSLCSGEDLKPCLYSTWPQHCHPCIMRVLSLLLLLGLCCLWARLVAAGE